MKFWKGGAAVYIYVILTSLFFFLLGKVSFASDKWIGVVLSSNSISSITTLDDCELISCYSFRQLAITTELTFSVSGGSDVAVNVYSSYNGDNWDTEKLTSDTITCVTNTKVQKSFLVNPDAMYLKVIVDNSDSSYAVTGATVTITGSEY